MQDDQGEKVNSVHFLVQNGSSGDIASNTEILTQLHSKSEKNDSHRIENTSKQKNGQETESENKLKNASEIDITKLNKKQQSVIQKKLTNDDSSLATLSLIHI